MSPINKHDLMIESKFYSTNVGSGWEDPDLIFPRKQLEREQWMSLNGNWDFLFDDNRLYEEPSQITAWPSRIRIPFSPESKMSGVGDTGFHPRCWYRRTFRLKKEPGKRRLMHFGAVDYQAHVWLNGTYLGTHTGGYTPFEFDITLALIDGNEQSLIVRADDEAEDLAKPRGKQDWQLEPHRMWYPRTTGIWQTVWIEEVPLTYIGRLRLTPHLQRWEIGVEAFLHGDRKEGLELRICAQVGERIIARDTYEIICAEVHRRIALSDPGIDDFRNELLWTPDKPTLIHLNVELLQDGEVIDHVRSYTALRSVSIQGDRFLLNGRPYPLRLVLDQGYWAESLLTAPTPADLKRDIDLVKEAGFNGVRKHQKIEDPTYLYLADVLGLMVCTEMPSAYRFTHESVQRLMKEWTEVIDRDMNHPCVILWVPFNESWGVSDLNEAKPQQSYVQALYHLTHTLDPTRPVIGNDGWESVSTDIVGIHDYDDVPERLAAKYGGHANADDILRTRRPGGRALLVEGYAAEGKPVMLTEFGGMACRDTPQSHHGEWGYSSRGSAEDFQKWYENLMRVVHEIELFKGFCYTQFTDTFQEANGLFRMDRTPKFSIRAMARATLGVGATRNERVEFQWTPDLRGEELPPPRRGPVGRISDHLRFSGLPNDFTEPGSA